jgi:phenylpropionate dioxygenase-like ring-hydroxylating dioxygenase large terminal subunit
MKPFTFPEHYYLTEIYKREIVSIFQKWQFIGFTFNLSAVNDYVCAEIADDSVIVKNYEGELKAFQNVCSHRFSRIHEVGCGNAMTICPYHGWVYDNNGLPHGIPKRNGFGDLKEAKLSDYRLCPWRIEVCGAMIFVCKELNGISLKDYLGETYNIIEQISLALGSQLDTHELIINANWKILVENTLENYHVNRVHPYTFQRLGASGSNFNFEDNHSSWSAELTGVMNAKWERISRSFVSRPVQFPGYFHQLIFPNLTIATTYGASFSIQYFQPINATQTRLVSQVFQAKLTGASQSDQFIVDALGESVVSFNREVFAEDKTICEQVQLGIQHASGSGILCEDEFRVYEFQRAYINIIEGTKTLNSLNLLS